MQVNLTIQERLKDLRVEQGLTLEQLFAETGIQSPRWENMKPRISRTSPLQLGGACEVLRRVHRLPAGSDRTKKSPKHRA